MTTFPKMFVTDLDGTMLGGFRPYSRYPESVSEFLDRLVLSGCSWATNTAWGALPQVDLMLASPLNSRPAYVSGSVGLELCTMRGNELIPVEPYSEHMQKSLDLVNERSFYHFIRDVSSQFDAVFISFNRYWFAFTPPERQLDSLFAFLEEHYPHPDDFVIELLPEEKRFVAYPAMLTKDKPVKEISILDGLKPEHIVVAGDQLLDLAMMDPAVAKYAICPANAREEVKQRVLDMNGEIGSADFGPGVVDAFNKLAKKNGWKWA